MALLIVSLALNVFLLRAVYKLISRAHQAEADSKMYKDDREYWYRKYNRVLGMKNATTDSK